MGIWKNLSKKLIIFLFFHKKFHKMIYYRLSLKVRAYVNKTIF